MPKDHRPRIGFGTSSASEQDFIPLRLIVVADLAPDGSPLRDGEIRLWRVDKDSFNEVLQSVCPSMVLHLENDAGSATAFTRIDIPLKDIKSFHPFSLVREVESLSKLLEGRQSLVDLRDRKLSRDQFLERLRSAPLPFLSADSLSAALEHKPSASSGLQHSDRPSTPRSDASQGGGLDALLEMIDAPDDRPVSTPGSTEGATRIKQFIDTMFEAGGTGSSIDRKSMDGLVSETERILSDQMNEILEDPQFCRLETAWRSLKFLVDRTDFREPIHIQAVAARKEDLSRVLDVLVEDAQGSTVPVAAVITDFEFDNSSRDMELLRESAGLAEQLQAPLIVNVGREFFGKENATAASRIPLLKAHLESPEYVKWAGLREAECSRWLGVAFNRFLLRGRYAEDSSNKAPFRYRGRDEGLWGHASWAVASLLVRSFAKNHWCGFIAGIQGGGTIEDLMLHPWTLPSGDETQIPLETVFLKSLEADFYEAGFLALQSGLEQDIAVLLEAPSAHQPERYPDPRDTQDSRRRSSLIYQMVASRFVQYMGSLLTKYASAASGQEMQRGIEEGLRAAMRESGSGADSAVEVRLQGSESRPGSMDVFIRITPGPAIWPFSGNIELLIPTRRMG